MCRWLERDPAGYQDGPSLYSYLGRNPMAGTDPYGLHLQSAGRVIDLYFRWRGRRPPSTPTPKSGPIPFPAGRTVFRAWRDRTPDDEGSDPRFNLSIEISCIDRSLVEEIGAVQVVKGGLSGWQIDDGRVTLLSDKSLFPPFYNSPALVSAQSTSRLTLEDAPTLYGEHEFVILLVVTKGKAAGHIYGAYRWHYAGRFADDRIGTGAPVDDLESFWSDNPGLFDVVRREVDIATPDGFILRPGAPASQVPGR